MTENDIRTKRLVELNLGLDYTKETPGTIKQILGLTYLPNVSIIHFNKNYEIDRFFHDKKMNCYVDNLVGLVSLYYIDNLLDQAYDLIDDMQEKLVKYQALYTVYALKPIGMKLMSKDLERYIDICDKIKNYNIKDGYVNAFGIWALSDSLIVGEERFYGDLLDGSIAILREMGYLDVAIKLEETYRRAVIDNDSLLKEINEQVKVKILN